jgi:hypothetical protein
MERHTAPTAQPRGCRPRRGVSLAVLALLVLSACGYFNSLYNARRSFDDARAAERRGESAEAALAYRAAIDDAAATWRISGDNGFDDVLDEVFADLLVGDVRRMLGRNEDGINPFGFAESIFNRNLTLTIGTEIRKGSIAAHFGETAGQFVRQNGSQGH